MARSDGVRLTLDEVDTLGRRVLTANGLAPDHAAAVAATIAAGERDACASHGLYRLLVCVRTLRAGRVVPDAVPTVEHSASALIRVDARGGYAQLAFNLSLPLLVARARSSGIAALAITRCVHFSALWHEIEALTAHGLVAFACTPSHAWVAPFGGAGPLFGTNPIAFGWPRPGGDPFVFDFATSMVARGEIELRRREGRVIPEGWAIDRKGHATTDAAAALDGAMLTFGGHKGSALAAMVELIAGPLIGEMTSAESLAADGGAGASPLGGELVIAIDPAGFLGPAAADHAARAETLFESMQGMGARLPSQRRFEARRRSLAEGVVVPAPLYRDIEALL
jgi:LDH2 family malate/lactate/ureidoglycolate dehydrogenase